MTGPAGALPDRIVAWLRDHPEGVPATEIARRFLKIQGARPAVAGRLVSALVGDDPRFRLVGRHLWGLAEVDEIEAEGAGEATGAAVFLYAVARPAKGDPDLFRFGFLRVEGEEERGEASLDRRRTDTGSLPDGLAALAAGATLVIFRTAVPFRFLLREPSPLTAGEPLRLRKAASAALPRESTRSPGRLARHLEIRYEEGDDAPLFEARLLRSIHRRLEEEGAGLSASSRDRPDLPFLRGGGREYLDALPKLPGVYQMRAERGELLYVGKSRDLRSRVDSYFSGYAALSDVKKEMVRRVVRIDVVRCGSEPEALIEEWRKIRRRRPPYNEKIEVRAGSPSGVAGRNLVLFLPSTDERSVTLYLMRADGAMLRIRARRNPKRTASLEEKIGRFFRGGPGEIEEGAFAILSRWVAEHREEVAVIDADACRDGSDLLRLVIESLGDPEITAGIRLDRI